MKGHSICSIKEIIMKIEMTEREREREREKRERERERERERVFCGKL